MDQHFGHGLNIEDLLTSMSLSPYLTNNYFRPWRNPSGSTSRNDSGSKITMDKDKFQVCLDVQQFGPNEITVKTVGRQIIIEGKHEEKEDEHGYISRHFVRKYLLPDGYKPEEVISTLSSDGVLNISAPKIVAVEEGERVVPIMATGPAHATIKESSEENN